MRTLGLIVGRAGSKGIPNKNLRYLAGRPLLHYTIEPALKSGVIDRLVLSTDSEDLATLGRDLGVEVLFLRPSELAQDDTPMLPVLQHAVGFLEQAGWASDALVLLQPTAPLRRPQHISEAVKLLDTLQYDSVVSVVEVPHHFSPDYVMRVSEGRLLPFLPEGEPLTRRQEVRPAYCRDGTVYAVRRNVLMEDGSIYGANCHPLILSEQDSVTLDTLADWELAEARVRERYGEGAGPASDLE